MDDHLKCRVALNVSDGEAHDTIVAWSEHSEDHALEIAAREARDRGLWYDPDEYAGEEYSRYDCGYCGRECSANMLAIVGDVGDEYHDLACDVCALSPQVYGLDYDAIPAFRATCGNPSCGVQCDARDVADTFGVCLQCADEAHEQDQYDFERAHAAGFGGLG